MASKPEGVGREPCPDEGRQRQAGEVIHSPVDKNPRNLVFQVVVV